MCARKCQWRKLPAKRQFRPIISHLQGGGQLIRSLTQGLASSNKDSFQGERGPDMHRETPRADSQNEKQKKGKRGGRMYAVKTTR